MKTSKTSLPTTSAALASPQITLAVQLLFASGMAGSTGLAMAQSTGSGSGNALPPITVTGTADAPYTAKKTITATKTDTPLIDTPQSISVVTKEQIQDQSSQGLAEALRYIPGVGFAQGEGNRETPIFRGVSTTGDFYIDGMRDDMQYYRDLYNIESVEVFRGPNAMVFGRGASGGLINRVSKAPGWTPHYSGSLTLGSDSNKRITADLNQPLTEDLAFRLNALYEDSDSYRDGVNLQRQGINPTLAWKLAPKTLVTLGYEYFKDDRVADRGIPSTGGLAGKPVSTDRSTFFGSAEGSPTGSELNALTALVEHEFSNGVQLRNRTRVTQQDKFYQNVFASSALKTGNLVAISAYNNATKRDSWSNQTDLTGETNLGGMKHKLLLGAEIGQQDTDNYRMTGYYNNSATVTSTDVPLSNPIPSLPFAYRQSSSDADNGTQSKVIAVYVQDQIELSPAWQLIAGLRYDRLEVDFLNNRNGQRISSSDDLVSPRLGLIYKPVKDMSLYANYSIAYQPRAGDQLSSLTVSSAVLKPEKFQNYELGLKWDVRPNLTATAALFRLDRSNVIVVDPANPSATILGDGQRTDGLELTLSGNVTSAWSVVGGYAYTDAKLLADTSAVLRKGATVGQVPKNTFTLWNRYDFNRAWAGGLGVIHRTEMFASTEQSGTGATNTKLPGYTRVDAAAFYTFDEKTRVQLNVENLFDKKYYLNAYNNNNITPGSPRAFRVSLNKSF
ncbi:MAG: TonB-dependent siderophore receptor [Aquabacterium sp.]|jgi:catecholate siderophore receptor|uniref:TonB-dependent receptor n=1 Tax=Aquabacterium sp. TaxID=1872578 RepID=UPI003BAE5BFA